MRRRRHASSCSRRFGPRADRPGARRGAIGYLLKDAEPEEITPPSGRPPRGEAPLAPKAAAALLASAPLARQPSS